MKIYILLILVFIMACKQESTRYIFDKDEDPDEYAKLQTLALQTCLDETNVFGVLEATSDDFTQYAVGTIYKVTETKTVDEASNGSVERFFQISSNDGTTMTLILKSSDTDEDKVINFTTTMNDDIIETVSTGICSTEDYYDDFSTSNSDYLTFEHERTEVYEEDDDGDADL